MKTQRYEAVAAGVATIYAEDAQQVANEYLIAKNGSLDNSTQEEKDAVAAWVAGDRNHYDLLKIGAE